MGGKQKQSQRTKGNVKPSSSGRSAALLSTASSLAGFPGLKDSIFTSFPAASVSEELDSSVDPNFQLVLKKMNKKDPITRVKALQEFIKLVECCKIEVLKSILPFWPRLFCLLVGDVDHRVREVANDAQRIVVLQAKRNIAPYLRVLAGPWFIAQFDTYHPAASAAVRGFQEAFPPNKLAEVIAFCHEEILKYISDNLLEQTIPKEVPAQRSEKQERIVIQSLLGFCHFIKIVQETLLEKPYFLQVCEKLLQSQQFWKFGVDKIPLVRSSWLSLMTAILEKVPHLFKENYQQLMKSVLGRLDETDVLVIPYIWQAALSIVMRLDDWSIHCDLRKQVLPHVWNVLCEGGYGCAATIFPNMLPLLDALLQTKELSSDKEMLINSFFISMRKGFDKKVVLQSKSESEAVAQCYVECVRYVGKYGIINSEFISEHLIPVIEITLIESKLNLLSRGMYKHICYLLRYWSSDRCISQYGGVCRYFWTALFDLFQNAFHRFENDSVKMCVLNQEVQFCCSLKNPEMGKNQYHQKVRFANVEEDTIMCSENEIKTINSKLLENDNHINNLQAFVTSVCLFYLKIIKEEQDIVCVIPLAKLLSEFSSYELMEHLTLTCNVSELFSTLSKICFEDSKKNIAVVVELACSMIQHLEQEKTEQILNIMSQDPGALVCIFKTVREKSDILQWFQGPSLNNHLITLTQELCSETSSDIRAVLMECGSKTSDGVFLVNLHTISSILSKLSDCAANTDLAVFAAEFLSNLQNSMSKTDNESYFIKLKELSNSTYKLIVALFCLCCGKENLTVHHKSIILNGWRNGVKILTSIEPSMIARLLTELSAVIRNELTSSNILCIEDIENLQDICVKLLRCKSFSDDETKMFASFIHGVLVDFELLENQLIIHCNNVLAVFGTHVGNLNLELPFWSFERVFHCILFSLFSSMIMKEFIPLESTVSTEADDASLEKKENLSECLVNSDKVNNALKLESCTDSMDKFLKDEENCKEFFQDELVEEKIIQIAIVVSACKIYCTFFQDTPFYNKSSVFINELHRIFGDIKTVLCEKGNITRIQQTLLEKASLHGGIWVSTLYLFCIEDDWLRIHKSLSASDYGEYSANIFFSKAHASSKEIPLQCLQDASGILEKAFWIQYSQDIRHNEVSTMIMNVISDWLKVDRQGLLYDCDVSRKSSIEVEEVVKKIYFLSACVHKCPFFVVQDFWDFIIISAAYYTQNLKYLQKFYFNSTQTDNILHLQSLDCVEFRNVCVFSVAVFDLLNSLTEFCKCVKEKEVFKDFNFEDHVNEWQNVFSEEVVSILTNIFISASGCFQHEKPSYIGHLFLQKFCSLLIKVKQDAVVCATPTQPGEKMHICCEYLHSPVSSLRITAYYIFKTYLKHFVVNDDATLSSTQGSEESVSDQIKFEIHPLLGALKDIQAVVDTLFADFSFGYSCIVQPHTDSYYYTSAYLLLWNLILEACSLASSELRYQYATILRIEGYLSSLLNNLFFLMPSDVMELLPKSKSTYIASLFSEPPQLCLYMDCSSQQMQHWACWVYYCAVSRLPALVRQWWSDTRAKVSSTVQKITVQYVTPLLCIRDLQAIQNQKTKWKNMEVKVHSKVRQVVAIYTIDEQQMELIITLPEEYPLATIQVDSHTTSLIGTSQWRNWVKQLSIFLTHQNGSLWDGLLLWKSNLDKRYEGVEECYICFSILHGTNFQIPKLCCKTCKKKFHTQCLSTQLPPPPRCAEFYECTFLDKESCYRAFIIRVHRLKYRGVDFIKSRM